MITRTHASHLGIQYTINTARDIIYWPRMATDVTNAVQKCSTCQQMQPAEQKESMMSYPLPKLPWQAVASDCFELEGKHYTVIVYLYSDYVEVFNIPDLSTQSLIERMKPIFATHGTAAVLITDNGNNYSFEEFRTFTIRTFIGGGTQSGSRKWKKLKIALPKCC
jgi:hypothetical protein